MCGLYDGEYQFVPPWLPGEIRVPSVLGVLPGTRMGRPFSSRAGKQRPLLMPINGGNWQGSSATAPIDGIAEHWAVFNDWQPDEAIAQWAAENVPEVRNLLEPRIVDRFKDHWRANKPMPPRDIAAAFRLWLGREREFDNRNGRPRSDRSRILEDVLKEARSSEPLVPITHRDGPRGCSSNGG